MTVLSPRLQYKGYKEEKWGSETAMYDMGGKNVNLQIYFQPWQISG